MKLLVIIQIGFGKTFEKENIVKLRNHLAKESTRTRVHLNMHEYKNIILYKEEFLSLP